MKKVLFTGDTLSQEKREYYLSKGVEIIPASYDLTIDQLISALQGCDGYILGGDEILTREVIYKIPETVKAISFFGAGYEKYIDAEAAKERGIMVSNTPGANSHSVAEMTIALLFACMKNLFSVASKTKQGEWTRPKTSDILGKTVGIIGLGNIGKDVARTLNKGLNCKILYSGNTPKKDIDEEIGSKFVSLDELLTLSDIILVHSALNEKTLNLLGKEEFNKMKEGVVLINTARAEIVNEDALYEALVNGKVKIAGFDVFYEEPITGEVVHRHKLLSLTDEQFIITPHMAYYTYDAINKMEQMAIDNAVEMVIENDCRYIVNR